MNGNFLELFLSLLLIAQWLESCKSLLSIKAAHAQQLVRLGLAFKARTLDSAVNIARRFGLLACVCSTRFNWRVN